jgi:hypothetical protein
MDDKFDEEKLFAHHKKQTEQAMKIVVALVAAVLLYTLYVLVFDD